MTADRVGFSPEARAEFLEWVAYLSEQNPDAGERARRDVIAAAERLAQPSPGLDGPPTELRDGVSCRRWFAHPVMIYHRRVPGIVEVLRVDHHARDPITRGEPYSRQVTNPSRMLSPHFRTESSYGLHRLVFP